MDLISSVECIVDIYPYESQGVYTFSSDATFGPSLLSVSTKKSIYNANGGSFTIDVVPGGPNGIDDPTTWTQIITPLSLVVIYMERGDAFGLPMIGVVTQVTEGQVWSDDSIYRSIAISGFDFGYFFSQYNYWNQFFLGVSQFQNPIYAVQDTKLYSGTIDDIGAAWFNDSFLTILGDISFNIPNNGKITVNTPSTSPTVAIPPNTNAWNQYQSGNSTGSNPTFSPVSLTDLFGYVFNPAILNGNELTIPFGSNLVSSTGRWIDKFKDIFQFPFFEFFVQTIPLTTDSYFFSSSGTPTNYTAPSATFTINDVAFGVYAIGRMNPTPYLLPNTSNFNSPVFTNTFSLNTDLWDNLINYTPNGVYNYASDSVITSIDFDPSTMFSSSIQYNLNEYYNFYILNPIFIKSLINVSQGQSNQAPYLGFPFGIDQWSISRYGWRPQILSSQWFSDILQSNPSTLPDIIPTIAQLITFMSSYYTPFPVMGNATYTGPLRPDIIAGHKFTYNPYKDTSSLDPSVQSQTWDFYIEEVSHRFVFGGRSTTELKLIRGLPSPIYNQTDGENLLINILSGTAHRYYRDYGKIGTAGGFGPLINVPLNKNNVPGVYLEIISSYAIPNQNNFFYNPWK